ncbi:ATP-binding protein [Candidatus Poriferisodalis sp.]|uniref:ATP-binding protein n=1 Tax=Candidatus Poriferisodalis sp. TaxID=3101277 RepID=UPI003B016C8D
MGNDGSYMARVVDPQIGGKLRSVPVVLIEGARGCGKTTASRQFAASEVLFDEDEAARGHAAQGTLPLLEGPHPMLLDEWPLVPGLWDRVRRAGDRLGQPGRFILSASAQPTDYVVRHSGAGRMGRVKMRPMSLWESGVSAGSVSLRGLFDSGSEAEYRPAPVGGVSGADELRSVIDWLLRGGWPLTQAMAPRDAQEFARDYLDEVCRVDVPKASGISHSARSVRRLLASLARNSSSEASTKTLLWDMGAESPAARQTVSAYLDALSAIFVYESQPAWNPRLMSRTPLRRSPKHHLVDPSLAAAAVGANADALFEDRAALGLLFESMAVRDMRIYAQASRSTIFHYRDKSGLEVDAVVERDDGRWIAAEVKLGAPDSVDAAARSLLALSAKVDTSVSGPPAALMVVTSTGQPHMRADGVGVVPLNALSP